MGDGTLAAQGAVTTLVDADLFYVDDGPGADAKCTGTVLKAYTSNAPTLVTPALGTVASGDVSACDSTSQTFVTPALGTPASGVLDNCTSTSMVLTTPVLGTVTSGDISACTSTSLTMVTPVLGTVTSGDISACTSTSLTMVTPVLGTVTSGDISACTSTNLALVTPDLGVPSAIDITAATGTMTLVKRSVTAGITAHTDSSQGAGPLTTDINQISVCANGGDAVTLPTAVAGYTVTIINNGAQACDVFPATDDDCGGGANTAVSLAAAANITYVSIDGTTWVPVT
jgi:hypothetical protein